MKKKKKRWVYDQLCALKDKLILRDWTCTGLCLLYLSVCLIKLRVTVREILDIFSLLNTVVYLHNIEPDIDNWKIFSSLLHFKESVAAVEIV